LVTIELTISAVTTPIKQAKAKKRMANWVFVVTFIAYKLAEIKGKVNRKKYLAIRILFWYIYCEKIHKSKDRGDCKKGGL
jgi:hypothetical protein